MDSNPEIVCVCYTGSRAAPVQVELQRVVRCIKSVPYSRRVRIVCYEYHPVHTRVAVEIREVSPLLAVTMRTRPRKWLVEMVDRAYDRGQEIEIQSIP